MSYGPPLPLPSSQMPPEVRDYLSNFVAMLEQRLQNIEGAAGSNPYSVTGLVGQWDLDAATATSAEVREVLATLLQDLINKGALA